MPAGGDLGFQLQLEGHRPQLGEPTDLRLGEGLEGDVRQGVAAPQREGGRGCGADGLGVADVARRASPFEVRLQLGDVDGDLIADRVTGADCAHGVGAERPPQL